MAEKSSLKRVLGSFDLIMMGVGCIIGVGIYILSGVAAANYAGPAVVISFILAGILCAFVALAYGELASMFPLAGSAYSYSYYAFGKTLAWFLGWTLLLEYTVASSAVAAGWSAYFQDFLKTAFNITWPDFLGTTPSPGSLSLNLPSIIIMGIITLISLKGIKESALFNNIVAMIKIIVLLFFVGLGVFFINPANWQPFIPERIATVEAASAIGSWELPVLQFFQGLFQQGNINALLQSQSLSWHYGIQGILTGAAVVFFTYIGFDMVSATAEETKNPQKDLPIGIIGSLGIATFLYIAVALVMTGIMRPVVDGLPNPELVAKDAGAPLAIVANSIGMGKFPVIFISLGALAGVTTTLLAMTLGLSRILMAISRDKFLPSIFSEIDSKSQTPLSSILICNFIIATIAATLPISKLAELCNLGTLAAFVFVCLSIIILRKKNPEKKRHFKCPGVPTIPIIGIIFCLVLMLSLPIITWLWFGAWLIFGAIIYGSYGRSRASDFPNVREETELESENSDFQITPAPESGV